MIVQAAKLIGLTPPPGKLPLQIINTLSDLHSDLISAQVRDEKRDIQKGQQLSVPSETRG
jgi:hypothetical protein